MIVYHFEVTLTIHSYNCPTVVFVYYYVVIAFELKISYHSSMEIVDLHLKIGIIIQKQYQKMLVSQKKKKEKKTKTEEHLEV